jgi:hypothetical protein
MPLGRALAADRNFDAWSGQECSSGKKNLARHNCVAVANEPLAVLLPCRKHRRFF